MACILLADDHPLYSEAARLRLERLIQGVTVIEARSVEQLMLLADARAADEPISMILLDYQMPGVHGIDGIAAVVERFPGVPTAVVSGVATADNVRAAIRAGARGFLPKTMSAEQFGAAIHMLLAGGSYLPADILAGLTAATDAGESGSPAAFAGLEPRDVDILRRVSEGRSNKEIARELALAEITIKIRVRRIFQKIGARNRSEAASIAVRAGVV